MSDISITKTINYLIDWLQARLNERNSWDGLTIIIVSVMALIVSPIIQYAAWGGLAYGGWMLWKKEKATT